MAQYPATCTLGHAAITIDSDAELQSHITSAHPSSDPATVRAALSSAAAQGDAVPPVPTLRDPLAAWGVTVNQLTSIRPETVCVPTGLTIPSLTRFLSSYGQSCLPAVDPDVGSFLLEFFRYTLFTAASEDASNAGSFQLRDKSGGEAPSITWTSFFNACKDHFTGEGSLFTPRRLMRTCEDVFWTMWNNSKIEALNDIRASGTPLSRRFRLPGGRHPKAYVVVPELFNNRLTPEERELRLLHMSTVTKVAAGGERSTYEGFDQQGQHMAYEAAKAQMLRLVAGAGFSSDAASRAFDSLRTVSKAVPPPPPSKYNGIGFNSGGIQ